MRHIQLKWLAAMALGAVLALVGVRVWDAVRYVQRIAPPSAQAVKRPLEAFTIDPSWVKSGTPTFRIVETARSPDDRSVTGLWACDGPGTFEWRYDLDETIHLLEGRVEIEYLGKHFAIEPGDTVTFHAGTKALWHVPTHAKKLFKLHYPGRLVMAWRRFFPAEAAEPVPAL